MDNLFEQMANITKAHAYDILADHVKELKEVINQLIEVGELEDLTFTDEAATKLFQFWVSRAKILSLNISDTPKQEAKNISDDILKNINIITDQYIKDHNIKP